MGCGQNSRQGNIGAFRMSLILFCDSIALYALARTMHIMDIMTLNGHSICCKDVIPVLWKELFRNQSSKEQGEVNKEVT